MGYHVEDHWEAQKVCITFPALPRCGGDTRDSLSPLCKACLKLFSSGADTGMNYPGDKATWHIAQRFSSNISHSALNVLKLKRF
jgi:hypothetical protein